MRAWQRIDERRRTGEPLDVVLRELSLQELTEALAGSAKDDAVAANAIAVVILNRVRRAQALGASLGIFLVTFLGGLGLLAADLATTGTLGFLEQQPHGLDVAAVALLAIATSAVALVVALVAWRRFRMGAPRA